MNTASVDVLVEQIFIGYFINTFNNDIDDMEPVRWYVLVVAIAIVVVSYSEGALET